MSKAAKPHEELQGQSRFIAFVDECGDHSMESIDRDFPLFVLATVIVERESYAEEIVPWLNRLKLIYWDHEGINLHSSDIRKARGPFSILEEPARRERFMADLTAMMDELPYTLFIVAIHKERHLERYAGQAWEVYELALTFTFERIVHFLEAAGETHLPVIAEARGKKEDRELEAAFYRLLTQGTYYIEPARFKALSCPLLLKNKLHNICGLQVADLCAHPSARHILKPQQPNRAYEVVRKHIYETSTVRGLKVFP